MSDVVIAGTSCCLPRASSYHELGNILSNNLEDQRGHSIEKDKVDINSFNIHPHQAENMDPKIRIFYIAPTKPWWTHAFLEASAKSTA